MPPPTIGERIEHARTKANLTSRELDRRAGLTEGHTRAIERSKATNVETDTLDAIARALKLSLVWLVRGEGPECDEGAAERAA